MIVKVAARESGSMNYGIPETEYNCMITVIAPAIENASELIADKREQQQTRKERQ